MNRTEFVSSDGRSVFLESDIGWEPIESIMLTSESVIGASMVFTRVKPVEEPTGLGAVVRAKILGGPPGVDVTEWVRVPDGYWHNKDDTYALWVSFDSKSIEILSEGWTPDE